MFRIKNFDQIMKLFWPIALTMLLTNTLSFVDSAMIANYDILGVGAISLATQIQFLFGPVYFAIIMGIGIYTVQHFSAERYDKLKNLAAIAIVLLLIVDILNFLVLILYGDQIIRILGPTDFESQKVIEKAIEYLQYYKYSIILVPVDMFFVYQYRAIKKPKISLILGVSQSLLNIFFNIFLIYGIFIFPELGIVGAALGTFISRIIIVLIYIIYSIKIKAPFLGPIKEMFDFDFSLFKEVSKNILPLILVEFSFGLGNLLYMKIYALSSTKGYTAYTIAKTISFVINAFVMATANVSGIMAGTFISTIDSKQNIRKEMREIFKFISLNSFLIVIISLVVLPIFIPFFTTNKDYQEIIKQLIIINGIWMGLRVFSSSFLAILKSGNDNRFVLLIDGGITFIVGIPITLLIWIIYSPSIIILRSMIIVEFTIKVLLGYYRYNKEKWINKI